MTAPLRALALGPDDADSAVLLLHGFGASAWDLAPLAQDLARPRTRFLLPDAPWLRATIAGGMTVQAWYDIRTIEPSPEREDPAGVRASAAALAALLAAEAARGVPAARTVVAGFSQGGAMALYLGRRHPERLAGMAGLSTYLVLADEPLAPANRATPALLAHGTEDDVVPLARGEEAARRLRAEGRAVRWSAWPTAHAIHPGAVEALRGFLDEVL